ncbi:MAG: hypothetical protein IPO87_12410 [Flavobacteriales bacterium]|nr:hypothetical protein [Flavobacteriales bacterium]
MPKRTSAAVPQVPVGVLHYYGYSSYAHTSLVNGWDDQYYVPLSPTGTAINKGVELALSHTRHHNFFYQVNGTLSMPDIRHNWGNAQ